MASGLADVVVVNTCSVTAAADQAARHAIRQVARLNPNSRVVATGCYATRRPDEVTRLPGVVRLVPNEEKGALSRQLIAELSGRSRSRGALLRPGDRGHTAFPLRVQTGCDERCAYCIVPTTRGSSRSLPVARVLDEVRALAEAGFKELWLTGVHLGSFGRDLCPPSTLLSLLLALDRVADTIDVSFRISSLEPMDCTDEVIDLVAGSPRFAPHFHLPLQHASDRMLAAMRRPYTADACRLLLQRVRRRLPDAAIGTDLIAGFPGETDRDFEQQEASVRAWPLTHVHVFPYSDRPGTAASELPSKVPSVVVRDRAGRLRAVARELNRQFLERQVGIERPALTLGDGTLALTDNYMKLRIPRGLERNERVRVRLVSVSPARGEVVS